MFTLEDVKDIRKLMKKFKGQGNHLIQFPNGTCRIINKDTDNLLPNGNINEQEYKWFK